MSLPSSRSKNKLLLSTWFHAGFLLGLFSTMNMGRHVPPKRQLTFNGVRSVIFHKIELIIIAVRTSNPTRACVCSFFIHFHTVAPSRKTWRNGTGPPWGGSRRLKSPKFWTPWIYLLTAEDPFALRYWGFCFASGHLVLCVVLSVLYGKGLIFWDITPCSPSKANRHFGGICRLHLQGRKIS
jgi:hypothetical protein